MKRKLWIDIYDDSITIGDAIKILDDINYDSLWGYGKEFVLWTSSQHRIDIRHLKTGVKVVITKEDI